MTKAAEEAFELVSRLAPSDRAELIDRLYALDDAADDEKDPGYDQAWAAEIRERIAEFDRDPTVGIPWQAAMAHVRRAASGEQ